MATYRLKSKLFGELDKEASQKKKGILGTGITGGQALLAAGTLVGGYKLAAAGKLGHGAQLGVNRFRMATSSVGSNRYMKGLTGVNNERDRLMKNINQNTTLTTAQRTDLQNAITNQFNGYTKVPTQTNNP
mgnify:CR=1 FL=1